MLEIENVLVYPLNAKPLGGWIMKKIQKNVIFLAVVAVCLIPVYSDADVIGSFSVTLGDFWPSDQSLRILFGFNYYQGWNFPPNYPSHSFIGGMAALFEYYNLTLADVGTTLEPNTPQAVYDYVVHSLTQPGDLLPFPVQQPTYYYYYSLYFMDGVSPFTWTFSPGYIGNGYDFEGYSISDIKLHIDDIRIIGIYPGWGMDVQGLWDVTLSVEGNPVPEPSTMLLLGSGLVGLAGFARKKFKK